MACGRYAAGSRRRRATPQTATHSRVGSFGQGEVGVLERLIAVDEVIEAAGGDQPAVVHDHDVAGR